MDMRREQARRRALRRRRKRIRNRLIAILLIVIAVIAAIVAIVRNGSKEEEEVLEIQTEQDVREEEKRQEERRLKEYGCRLYGEYDYPFNTMSQDWSGDQVEGFYYHEISEECKAAGGQFPVIMQVYTYILCKEYGVDYEMTFALIEKESKCVWNACGDGGDSIGFMQIAERWQEERMQRLNCTDLTQPFQNVKVGVDILSELQEKLKGTVPDKQLPYDVLAAYNYGMSGAKKYLWSAGVHEYSYNREIMERAEELKQETAEAKRKNDRECAYGRRAEL